MGLDDFLSNAAKSVGSTVGSIGVGNVTIGAGAKVVSDAVAKVTGSINDIPVLGPILGVYTPINWVSTINNIARGERIDKAALGHLKKTVKDYKAVAPYAASVISFVPGVGTGISSGIMAGAALAEGQPLSTVALEAVKGSLPGGPIAAMAFNAARAAAEGQPVDQIAINALPVNEQAKQAIRMGLALTKDLADGKKIDDALLARVDDGFKLISPELGKALTTGLSVGIAQKLQREVVKQISSPQAKEILRSIGNDIASNNALAKSARFINPSLDFQRGFDIGIGMMHGKVGDLNMITALRNALTHEQQKGFDTAAALKIGQGKTLGKSVKPNKLGRVKKGSDKIKENLIQALKQVPPNKQHVAILSKQLDQAVQSERKINASKPSEEDQLRTKLIAALQQVPPNQKIIKVLSEQLATVIKKNAAEKVLPTQAAGFLITQGLVGASEQQKVGIVSDIAQNPIAREGAADAIKEIAEERKPESLWDRIVKFFFGN